MPSDLSLVSPNQVARAIGVSESSLKRWCDQGLIPTARTAGGHRKLSLAGVLQFVREHGYSLAAPEVLGLPPVSDLARLGLSRGADRLTVALLAGDDVLARQIVVDLYLARHPLSAIFDETIATAFHAIGERWACQQAEVHQERRACTIVGQILAEVRRMQAPPPAGWTAIGATLEGDLYELPCKMAELVLRDVGYQASLLGCGIPAASLADAVQQARPRLFWLSVSHVREGSDFLAEFAILSGACEATGTALVVGGQALTAEWRQRMTYSAFGDTMHHLEAFAKSLKQSPAARRRTK